MGITPGPRKFNLWKIAGGDTHQADSRNYYKVKSAEFNDNRNPEIPKYVRDILFSEEQLASLVLWLKAILEHYRIPKTFLRDPVKGKENPWIDTDVLARRTKPAAIRAEAIERASSHQGVWGHMNLQRSRVDPGASMDYYRLKRGISDKWWYPVNLDGKTRALNYLDAARSTDYLALTEYGDLTDLDAYYRLNEEGKVGFYPIGSNRVWHGAIHLDSGSDTKQVYSMANGWIVAARVTNGMVNGHAPTYSRCFVLIKHMVHTQDNGDEIEYGANSSRIVYSLYMHIEPAVLAQRTDNAGGQRWDFDYATMPSWLCHFLIDNGTHATVNSGGIIYPNHKVDLSDYLGNSGTYITEVRNGKPILGRTVHVEVFTTEDPNSFGANPWTAVDKRVIDPTPEDVIADYGMLDSYVYDTADDGIDIVDIKNAAPGMRSHAIKSRSEWSLTDKAQLGHHQAAVTDDEWATLIRPLCFHADIAADAAAPAAEIGPFHRNTTVWHFHPFTFLQWMNERVERHERILAEQDKPRPTFTSNVRISGGYVTGFQNLGGANPNEVAQQTGGVVYPEVEYNENSYEVTVDKLADLGALTMAAQNATRFNLRLLEAVDICNDRLQGLQILEGYVSTGAVQCSDPTHHAVHRAGNAADLRPANTTVTDWYNLYDSARQARTYLQEFHELPLELHMTTDPSTGTPSQAVLNQQAAELLSRLQAATTVSDPVLTAAPAVQYLDQMRLHMGITPNAVVTSVELHNVRWLDATGTATTGPVFAGQRLRIEVQTVGIKDGATVDFFILSEIFSKRIPPDITDISTLQRHYGSRNFELNQIELHHVRPTTVDTFEQRIQKQLAGADATGRATVVCDWQVPLRLSHGTGSLYAVCIVGAGAETATGITTSEHLVAPVLAAACIQVPKVWTNWAIDARGRIRVGEINRNSGHGYVVVDTDALPSGCLLSVSVRDTSNNHIVLEESQTVAAGSATTTVVCPAPDRDRQYHATVRITRSGNLPVDLTSGAGVSWVS